MFAGLPIMVWVCCKEISTESPDPDRPAAELEAAREDPRQLGLPL